MSTTVLCFLVCVNVLVLHMYGVVLFVLYVCVVFFMCDCVGIVIVFAFV